MGEICLGSKELQVNLSPKSESLPTFLVNLMQQAEKYLKSCNIPETLKVLYHVFNLVPIFSTEYKSIRHIILTLHSYFQDPAPLSSPTATPCSAYFNSNSHSTRYFLIAYLVLAGMVEILLQRAVCLGLVKAM